MNRVCHFELPYEDHSRATAFYKDVFGWQLMDMPGMDYCFAITTPIDEQQMPTEPGGINGGLYKRAEGPSAHPVVVMEVDDCDAHLTKVTEAGGTVVVPRQEIPGMGLYAQVKDTEGNIIGLWQSLKS